MLTKRYETIIRRVYKEIFNEGDLEVADEVISSNAVDHAQSSLSSLSVDGPDSIKAFVATFCAAFPDAHWSIDDIRVNEDRVIIRTEVSGSHHAEFLGMRPTGRQFTVAGMDIVRIADDKIEEHWGELDIPSMQEQLQGITQAQA